MEIERKFLVKGNFKGFATSCVSISQGYLSTEPERTVRVRTWDKKGFVTVKGKSSKSGLSRFEWEKEIDLAEAQQLMQLCLPVIIEKKRYLIPESSGLIFEVDEFFGAHEGLIIAEIELPREDAAFEKPEWLGEEVTGDVHYYNSYLSKAKAT